MYTYINANIPPMLPLDELPIAIFAILISSDLVTTHWNIRKFIVMPKQEKLTSLLIVRG